MALVIGMGYKTHGNRTPQPAAPEPVMLRPSRRRKLLIAPSLVAVIMLACVPALVGQGGPRPPANYEKPSARMPKPPEPDHRPAQSPTIRADNIIRQLFSGVAKLAVAEAPPAPQPVPSPPAPPAWHVPPATIPEAEPSNPNIVLDCPPNGVVGSVIVVSAARSTNYRKMKWSIVPPATFYPNPRENPNPREIVFAVPTDGIFRVTVKATSPDGGLDERTESVQVGNPETSAGPGPAMAPRPRAADYPETVRDLLGDVKSRAKREEAGLLSLAFHDVAEDIANDRIRNEEEFVRKVETEITRRLDSAEPTWDTFNTKLGERFKLENGNMQAIKSGCEEVSTRLEQYQFYGR